MKYQRKETYSPIYVHDELMNNSFPVGKKWFFELDGDRMNADSQRYQLFETNTKCVVCGCEGEYYAKEKSGNAKRYHLNLYAVVDGVEKMMTKDHILAKANGGKNIMSNYQTMCAQCNEEKGSN